MKLFKILSHPYTLIICFCLIMISGEHLGGLYLFYILLGLPFGAMHSLLALAGMIIILVSYHRLKNRNALAQLLNIAGVLLLFASIYCFFRADTEHYNWGSFEQTVPLVTMIITTLIAVCFLAGTFIKTPHKELMAI